MTGFFLSLCCLFGFTGAVHRGLKMSVSVAPFFCVSLLGVLLFLFARFDLLKPGAFFLMISGLSLFAIMAAWGIRLRLKPMLSDGSLTVYGLFGLLLLFAFIMALGMQFTTVDDYVWWGIVGKYLYFYDHLPWADTTIIKRHLGYTPGTSLIHYLFYRIMGEYKPSISYFAQNVILISALLVMIKQERVKQGLVLVLSGAIVTGLFCGSILTKLQVDYLLSVFFFAGLWVHLDGPPSIGKVFALSMPILFLSIIKEIGFVLSFVLLGIITVDTLFRNRLVFKEKVSIVSAVFLTGTALVVIKMLWQSHCQAQGFGNFSGAITMETIRTSLDIFNDESTRKGFVIFIKGLLFGEADRLNLPYLFWYAVSAVLWIKISRSSEPDEWARIRLTLKLLVAAIVAYVVMNYFMQLIVFEIGSSYMETVGLERYLNILFVPVFLLLFTYGIRGLMLHKGLSVKVFAGVCVAFVLMNALSRVETSVRREPHYLEAQQIAEKIEQTVEPGSRYTVAVVPGINDNELWIPLLYYLLPNDVSRGRFPAASRQAFFNNLKKYDYVLFQAPHENTVQWLAQSIDTDIEAGSFYRILNREKSHENWQPVLERIF